MNSRITTNIGIFFALAILAMSAFSTSIVKAQAQDQEQHLETARRKGRPFLPWEEKRRLLWRGEVKDAEGRLYNIRILPGFVKSGQWIKNSYRDAGDAYQDAWQSIKDDTKKMRAATGDCLNFAFKDSGEAWGENFGNAKRRMEKGAFGWWMAYPWAAMRSSVETTVRVPVGMTGATISSTGFVPATAWHGGWATLEAGFEVTQGTILPISAMAWHAVATPPLAMLEKTPSPSSVDERWVEIIKDTSIEKVDKSHPVKESLDVIKEIK